MFETTGGPTKVAIAGPMRANSGMALREAARNGVGIILQPRLVVRDAVETDALQVLLARHRPQPRPLQRLTHRDRRRTPKLRAFTGALVDVLGV